MVAVTPEALMAQIAGGTAPVVLDVRSKTEFDAGTFPARFTCRSGRSARAWRDAAPRLRETPVVVYCGHGPRAYIAGAALKRRGFTSVIVSRGSHEKMESS